MRYSELKQRYDPHLGKYAMKHIYDETTYGEGLSDILKSFGKKIFERTGKKLTKKAAKTTNEYVGKKAGDKIVELLSKNRTTVPPVMIEPTVSASEPKTLTTDEINDRVNMILSGGKLRRRKFT